jgi:hypothetical protein
MATNPYELFFGKFLIKPPTAVIGTDKTKVIIQKHTRRCTVA